MERQLECPVCEQRFTISKKPTKDKIQCPGCSREFKVRAGKDEKTKPRVSPAASAALPTAIPLAKPIAPQKEERVVVGEKSSSAGIRPNKSTSAVFAAAKRKRRKQKKIRAIVIIFGLAAIVGILAGLLVMRLSQKKKTTADNVAAVETTAENSSGAQGSDSAVDTKSAVSTSDVKKDTDPEPVKEKQIRKEELAPQKFIFHDEDQVDDCWDLVHPHLVKLTVHDARGSHPAVGTIVDSRGWILTSYSAIKGASKIEAASGYKSIDQFYQPPKLSDTVRGIITSDPQQDIAVLSINRRFVESFASIVITEKDFVVEGEYLVQCTPPTPESAYGCYESKISISGKFDDLAPASKSLAKSMELTSTELPWIVCQDKQMALPGAPLVRIDGTLEAIHVFSQDNNAHYVPIHLLKPMLASASDKPQPLSVLQDSSGSTGAPDSPGVAVDHPVRKTSVQLNRLADICEGFNWIPSNEKDYEQLREFSDHFATAINYIKTNQKSDPELTSELQTQISGIKKSISVAINKTDQASVEEMNRLAAIALKRPKTNRVVPLYGTVAQLEVSAGNDVLKLVGTSVGVALNPDIERDRFFRGDLCLAFVEVPKEPSLKAFKVQEQTIQSTVVDLITRINVSRQ